MLAHSPPFPLVIDYFDEGRDIPAEDEEAIILALKQRDRVRRVRLHMTVANVRKFIVTIDEEYPILEYLIIMQQSDKNPMLKLPDTLQAPHLRHLALIGFALPVGSRLLTTAVDLVTACLLMEHPSTYFHPNTLLQWLSSMPQLETLVINFLCPVSNREVKRQITDSQIMTPVTLPNLRRFRFRGVSNYLEALIDRIIAPRCGKLEIDFFNQLTFSVPCLRQFIDSRENSGFEIAKFKFSGGRVAVEAYPRGETDMHALSITVDCRQIDWQVSSVAQLSHSLSRVFSEVEVVAVERLTEQDVHNMPFEEHKNVERVEWCKLLNSFSNMKILRIDNGLVEELSRCLESGDEKLPVELLLPELQELTYYGSSDSGDTFALFVEARQNAGRPITLIRRSPVQNRALLFRESETPLVTPTSSEAGDDFDA